MRKVSFSCVLLHKLPCGEFNAKSCLYIYISKVGDLNQGRPEGSLFNSYYTEV